MSYKEGLLEKLRLCAAFLFTRDKRFKNVHTLQCDVCNNFNVQISNKHFSVEPDQTHVYIADYKCLICGATGAVRQEWIPSDADQINAMLASAWKQ